jgi:hypothetical protein
VRVKIINPFLYRTKGHKPDLLSKFNYLDPAFNWQCNAKKTAFIENRVNLLKRDGYRKPVKPQLPINF